MKLIQMDNNTGNQIQIGTVWPEWGNLVTSALNKDMDQFFYMTVPDDAFAIQVPK